MRRATEAPRPLIGAHRITSSPVLRGSCRLLCGRLRSVGQGRAPDDDQERSEDPCFRAKEQSWHTAMLARSLLSWTNLSSGWHATRDEVLAALLISGRLHRP